MKYVAAVALMALVLVQLPAQADITNKQRLQIARAKVLAEDSYGAKNVANFIGAPGAYQDNTREVAYYVRRAIAVLGDGRTKEVSDRHIEAARRLLDRGHVLRTAHDPQSLNEAIHLVEDVIFFAELPSFDEDAFVRERQEKMLPDALKEQLKRLK